MFATTPLSDQAGCVLGRSRVALLLAIALGLAASGCAESVSERGGTVRAAAAPPSVDREVLRRERRITALLNRASRSVAREKRCRAQRAIDPETTFTDATPSGELLGTFAILRRPQTEEERIPDNRLTPLPVENVYRSAYRIATSSNGRRYLIVAAQNTNTFKPRPPECADALRRDFEAELEGRSPEFKRHARKALHQIIRDEWSGGPDSGQPHEGLFMFEYGKGGVGGGGGGGDIESVRKNGMIGTQGTPSASILSALLPDPVATVELTFPRAMSRGAYRPPKRYARAVTLTAQVKDNVISVQVPRPPQDAFPARMVWKGPDGQTIRVVRGRR